MLAPQNERTLTLSDDSFQRHDRFGANRENPKPTASVHTENVTKIRKSPELQ